MKRIALVLVLVAAVVGLTRFLWPRTETLRLPGRTDTVTVTSAELDTVWRTRIRDRWREVATTDTLTLVDTLWQTKVETVAVLAPRWYLDSAKIAAERGDSSYYALTWLAADSGTVRRRDRVERQVTLGPVRQIATDSSGLHVDYGEFRSCSLAGVSGLGVRLPLGIKLGPGASCGVQLSGGGFGCVAGASVAF